MCSSAASWQRGLITVAIKTGKNFSLPTGGSCHHTSHKGFLETFHPCAHYAQLSLAFARTHARTAARPPFSLALPFSHASARNSRNISQYCVRSNPLAPACIQWETFFHSLMKSWEKKGGLVVSSLHPFLVAWEGPTLWAERPQPSKTLYTVLLMDGCQAANTGP